MNWIKVEDRLPEITNNGVLPQKYMVSDKVLVHIYGGYFDILKYSHSIKSWQHEAEVTHWCEIVPPPNQ